MEFVLATASLLAVVYGIPIPIPSSSRSSNSGTNSSTENLLLAPVVQEAIKGVVIERFSPKAGVQIPTTDEEAKATSESKYAAVDIDQECSDIIK